MTEIPESAGGFRIVSLGRTAAQGRWRIEALRSYSTAVVLWFTRGQGRITIDGVTRGYNAHNAFFLPPGTLHSFEVGQQVLGVSVAFPADMADLPDEVLHLKLRDVQAQAHLTQHIDALQRESASSAAMARTAARAHGTLIAVALARAAEEQRDAAVSDAGAAAECLARAFARLVEVDFASGKTVGDYARALGVTATHLSRACRQANGRPASALLTDRIMADARLRLADSATPVKTIARDLGFGSAAYFTRAFQAHTGATPTAFRRRATGSQPRH